MNTPRTKPYSTDLTDAEWAIVEPLLPQRRPGDGRGAPRTQSRREILNAISRGFSYAETAQMLDISVGTVHTFLKRIYRKLAVHSKTEAVFEANRLGLIR